MQAAKKAPPAWPGEIYDVFKQVMEKVLTERRQSLGEG